LQAVDLGSLGRPCLRITPEAIKEFEHRMAPVAPAPKRRKQPAGISPSVAALLAEEGGSRGGPPNTPACRSERIVGSRLLACPPTAWSGVCANATTFGQGFVTSSKTRYSTGATFGLTATRGDHRTAPWWTFAPSSARPASSSGRSFIQTVPAAARRPSQ